MDWIAFPDPRLPVFGLPFFAENQPRLWRLPQSRRDTYRPPVWDLACSPAGGRLRFATNAAALAVRLDYGDVGHMNNMHRIGQHAVDCFADGVYWNNASPLEGQPQVEVTLFEGVAAIWREITLHLPLYHPVQVLALGFSDGAECRPPAPFARELPVVFYGSSITQGGCAARPGNSYQAFVCRELNLDHVNLGFSGNGIGEPELAQAMADIEACCYVVDYSQNCPTTEQMRETYAPFLETLRGRHPAVPVLCVTPIGAAAEAWSAGTHENLERKREVVRDAVAQRWVAGDRLCRVVEGRDLLGEAQMDGMVDSSHPNDLGFWWMAQGLREPLRQALAL